MKIGTLAFLTLQSPTERQSQDWLVHRQGAFRVYHGSGQIELARKVGRSSAAIAEEYSQRLDMPFSGETYLFLVTDDGKWSEITQGAVPDWSDGFAKRQAGIVYIHLRRGQNLNSVLRHELIHIILGKNTASGAVPRWFEEGLASFCSGDPFMDHHAILSMANLTNSLLSLADVDEMLAFNRGKAKLAYAQSLAGFKLIFAAADWQGVRQLFAELRAGTTWAEALQNQLGMSEEDFEWYLHQHIADRFKWDFIFQFEVLLWTVIPALVIVGFIVVRLRRSRVYRRWQDEEAGGIGTGLDE